MISFSSMDGAREFIKGPTTVDGTEYRNIIHTVINGFCVDWVVMNFERRSVRWIKKSIVNRERLRESKNPRSPNIPDGTWSTLKQMALEELDAEVERRKKPARPTKQPDGPQHSLF